MQVPTREDTAGTGVASVGCGVVRGGANITGTNPKNAVESECGVNTSEKNSQRCNLLLHTIAFSPHSHKHRIPQQARQ